MEQKESKYCNDFYKRYLLDLPITIIFGSLSSIFVLAIYIVFYRVIFFMVAFGIFILGIFPWSLFIPMLALVFPFILSSHFFDREERRKGFPPIKELLPFAILSIVCTLIFIKYPFGYDSTKAISSLEHSTIIIIIEKILFMFIFPLILGILVLVHHLKTSHKILSAKKDNPFTPDVFILSILSIIFMIAFYFYHDHSFISLILGESVNYKKCVIIMIISIIISNILGIFLTLKHNLDEILDLKIIRYFG